MTATMTVLLVAVVLVLVSGLAMMARRDYRSWLHRKAKERSRYSERNGTATERSRDTTVVRSA